MSQLSYKLDIPADGCIVVIDDVITNVGGAYSNTTGVFRAPVNGNFMFSVIESALPKTR